MSKEIGMIELVNECHTSSFENRLSDLKWHENIFSCTMKIIQKKKIPITIISITNDAMRKLHAAYYGSYRVTDVLSFFYPKSVPHEKNTGEIFICIEQAKKQALRYHVSFQQELKRLIIHGLLHVYGYDHKEKHERKEMVQLTQKILTLC